MNPYPLLFMPEFKHRIWGGSRLKEWFEEYPSAEASQVGEAWILSDHGAGRTRIQNGPYADKTLGDVIVEEPGWFPAGMKEFPLLFKIIDAAKDLSVQVHPDDNYGFSHAGERGKTECWWVLDAEPDAKIVYGHYAATRGEFVQAVETGRWDALLKSTRAEKGQFWFVPAGKIHALGAGTMVLEVQQSSDTTYRVYDYDRRDANGQLRQLHLEDAYNVISFPDETPDPQDVNEVASRTMKQREVSQQRMPEGLQILADSPFFQVSKYELKGSTQLHALPELMVICPTNGNITLQTKDDTWNLKRGHAALLPQGLSVTVATAGEATVLITTIP